MKLHRKLLRNMLLIGAMIVTSVSDVSAEQNRAGPRLPGPAAVAPASELFSKSARRVIMSWVIV